MFRRSLFLLGLLLSAPLLLFGQEGTDTLTASTVYSVQSLPAVRPSEEVSLPDQADVPAQLADVLRRFTGVQVKDYGGLGGLKTVNVRSLGSEHVGIFVDGIQVDQAQNMQVDLSRFSTAGIGGIALYPALKAQRLQTAKEYAAGAAVHLLSERPSGDGGRARVRLGSFRTVSPSFQWDKTLGRTLTLRSSAEFLYSGGRYPYAWYDTTLMRENSDIRSLRLEAQLFGQLPRGSWQLRLYSYGSERGFPGPVIRRSQGFPFSAERQADQDSFLQGSWEQQWSPRYSTALRLKVADNYTHYNSHPERNPMALPYDLHYRQQSGYVSLAQSYVMADPWSVDLAGDLQYNTLDSDVGQFVRPRRAAATAALASRLTLERFRAAAHLAWIGAWDDYDHPQAGGWSRERSFRGAWMPSLSVLWNPGFGIEASAYARRSYRLPSFNDLYYSQMGNSALVPESATQLGGELRWESAVAEGGCGLKTRGHPRPRKREGPIGNDGRGRSECGGGLQPTASRNEGTGAWGWHGSLRVAPYYNRVAEKIVAIPTASQFRWTMLNIGRADVTGIDAKAEGGLTRGDWQGLLTLRYCFQQALDHSTPGSQTYGNQIPYVPRHSGSASLTVRWRDWSFCWDSSFSGEKWSRSANTADYRIAPWRLHDASLSKRIALPEKMPRSSRGMTIRLRISNVAGADYEIVQGYPMPRRNALLSIEYHW